MRKSIDIDVVPTGVVEIEGALVARKLGLEVAEFRALMDDRKIAVLCERGKGEHAGLYRASFYHRGRRARFVVDGNGEPGPPAA